MHRLQMYENLHDMLEQEISKIQSKGELDPQSLDNLDKLMRTVKNTDKCIDREGGGQSYGSYNNMRSYDNMGRSMMMPMESYGMGRDSDGRFSRDNFRDSSFRGGSYGQSYEYSRDNAPMMQRLESMMNEARNDSERQAIKDFVNRM